ncbi:MAG: hypothetical protein ACM31C_10045 [Acidobacteriota bacterium]
MRVQATIALGLTLAACYQPTAATGVPCAANGDCPGTQVCDHGRIPPVCVGTLPAIDAPSQPTDARLDAPSDAPRPPDAPPPDAPPPTATLVQQVTSKVLSSDSLMATLPAAPAAGHVLIMVGDSPQAQIVSVTGGGVATWSRAAIAFTSCNAEIWYGVTDGTSSTVTISDPMTSSELWMNLSEWSGLSTTLTFDGAIAQGGTTSPASAGMLPTGHAHDLVIFTVSDNTPNTYGMPGPGTWTAMTPVQISNCGQVEYYSIVNATGTYAPSVSVTTLTWDAAIAAFQIP